MLLRKHRQKDHNKLISKALKSKFHKSEILNTIIEGNTLQEIVPLELDILTR